MMTASYGKSSTSGYLESLLSFALRGDTTRAAEALVKRYGTLDLAASAPIDELAGIDGMNESAAILLSLAISLTSRRVTEGFELGRVYTEDELKRYLVGLYLGVSVETVYLLLFDKEGRVISLEYMGEGTVSASDIYPRRLLECAIKRGAASAILVHNHPRSTVDPSKDDVFATSRIAEVFRSASVQLLAHYVVAERNVSKVPMGDLFYG